MSSDDNELKKIEVALDTIEPSTLTYQEWVSVLMALHSADVPVSTAEEWSSRDSRYKPGECEQKYKSFRRGHGVTIATLFDMAKKYGVDFSVLGGATGKSPKQKRKEQKTPEEKSPYDYDPQINEETGEPFYEQDPNVLVMVKAMLEKNKAGRILINTRNVKTLFDIDPLLKDCAGFDLFNQRIARFKDFPWTKQNLKNDSWRDVDDSGLQNYIESNYGIRHKTIFSDVFLEYAHTNSFHPVQDYFKNLPEWDGVLRADTVFVEGLDIEYSEYTRKVTRHWLIAAVARIFHPGCKWDSVLVIKSPQGAGKSTLFRKLGVNWFTDSLGTLDGKDAMEQLQGNWIIELSELQATKKTDNEQIKAFISRQVDKFRKAYGVHTEIYPRQCVFCGSTNSEEFLKDHTGGRRFLILVSNATADTFEARMKDFNKNYVDQIWAEVYHWYKELFKDGFDDNLLDLPQDIKKIAAELQKEYTEGGELEAAVTAFLEKLIPREQYWRVMTKRERRMWFNGEMTSIEASRVGATGGAVKLEPEVPRDRVCAAEILYESMNIDNPPEKRGLIRQVNEILANLPKWHKIKGQLLRFGEYGRQRTAFEKW